MNTDKAIAPVKLYGATKLVSEKLFIQDHAYSGTKKTRFAAVRWVNVR